MDHGRKYSNSGTLDLADQSAAETNVIPVVVTQCIVWLLPNICIAGRPKGDYRKLRRMKQFHQPLFQTIITGFLLSVLLLAGCAPLQPISSSTIPTGRGTAAVILTWEGAPLGDGPACVHLTVDANGHAAFGACDNIDQAATIGESHLNELDAMQRRFAAFRAETAVGTVTFNGSGTSDSAAWQRAIGAWAQLVYSELASGTAGATGATLMSWFPGTVAEEPTICTHLTVLVYGYVYADTVPCGGGEVLSTTGGWLNDAQMAQLDYWRTTFAPLYVENSYLNGNGTQAATDTWQRAVNGWAQLVYDEVSSGRTSAAGATASGATTMSWFIDSAAGNGTLCQHLTVLTFGYAYAEIVPCDGGVTVQATGGSLTDEELTQLDRWISGNEALYVDNNYLAGTGSTPIPADEVATVETWATALYDRLANTQGRADDAMDLTTWAAYEADSGFVIYYPPTLYTVDVLENRTGSPFSGAIVFTPTDALTGREPLAATYRLSILAHVANKAYSLSEGATFLANGQLLSYDPALLDGQTITRTNLAGAPAVRVDELPVGQAGVAIQLAAIRADIVYELVVEPAQMSSGNAAADQANLALVEQMIKTLRFTR